MAKMERQDQNSARGSILSSAPSVRYMGYAKTTDDMWYEFDVKDGTKRAPAMEQARRVSSYEVCNLVYVRRDVQAAM